MKTIRDGYAEALIELARKKEDIVVLSADSAQTTGVKNFAKECPNRFVQCGKAEQNMMGIATGLAMEGKIPFVSTCMALGKNLDQIRAICGKNQNVKIADTENILEDVAIARALPNITIIAPADYYEAKKATIAAGTLKGPVYLKLGTEKTHITTEKTPFNVGKVEIIRAGKDCTIIACGTKLQEAVSAAEKLSQQEIECTVLDCHTIKPIDKHAIISSARITGCIVTTEENPEGGLGSAVAEILSQNAPVPMRITKNDIVRAVKDVVLQRCESVCTTIPEEHGRMLQPHLEPELYFRVHGGGIVKSVPGLHKALINMNNETFSHHCSQHKNDFSTWIKDVFKEKELAKNLEEKHTRIGMMLTLAKWLK